MVTEISIDEIGIIDFMINQARRLAMYLTTATAGADPDEIGYIEVLMLDSNVGRIPRAFVWHENPNSNGREDDWLAFLTMSEGEDGGPEWTFEGTEAHRGLIAEAMGRAHTSPVAEA